MAPPTAVGMKFESSVVLALGGCLQRGGVGVIETLSGGMYWQVLWSTRGMYSEGIVGSQSLFAFCFQMGHLPTIMIPLTLRLS